MAQNPSNVIPDQLIVVEGGKQLVPPPSSGDSGKVLGVLNSNGDIGWTEDREGMAQQQADWAEDDPSKVTYIANKPTIPTVDQTYSASSSNAQSGVAVAGAIAGVNSVPASTISDSGKVLKVDAQGAPVWDDAGGAFEIIEWNSATYSLVKAAYDAGKQPVILDKTTYSSQPLYGYLVALETDPYVPTRVNTFRFLSLKSIGSYFPSDQSATTVRYIVPKEGLKSSSETKVAAKFTTDSSVTLTQDGVGQLKISVANPLPASASTDEGKVLTVNSSGDAAWATPSTVTVDQTYSASSTNAQSGTAVAGAVSGIRQVPSSSSGDSGKVLTVNSSGNPTWQTASGGGSQSRCNYLRIYDPDSSTSWDRDTVPNTDGYNLYVTGTWSLANLFCYYANGSWATGLRDSHIYMLSGIIPAHPSNGVVGSGEIFITTEQFDPSDPMMTQDYTIYRQPVNAKAIITFDNNGNSGFNAVQFSVVLPPMSINTWESYSPNTNHGCYISLQLPSGDSWSIPSRTDMTDSYAERMKIFCTAIPMTDFHYYLDPQ